MSEHPTNEDLGGMGEVKRALALVLLLLVAWVTCDNRSRLDRLESEPVPAERVEVTP